MNLKLDITLFCFQMGEDAETRIKKHITRAVSAAGISIPWGLLPVGGGGKQTTATKSGQFLTVFNYHNTIPTVTNAYNSQHQLQVNPRRKSAD